MIKIKFRKDLYSMQAVKKAIEAYSQVGVFQFSEKGSYYCVGIKSVDYNDVVRDELANYVLALTKNGS